jgi:hypothetical protein
MIARLTPNYVSSANPEPGVKNIDKNGPLKLLNFGPAGPIFRGERAGTELAWSLCRAGLPGSGNDEAKP